MSGLVTYPSIPNIKLVVKLTPGILYLTLLHKAAPTEHITIKSNNLQDNVSGRSCMQAEFIQLPLSLRFDLQSFDWTDGIRLPDVLFHLYQDMNILFIHFLHRTFICQNQSYTQFCVTVHLFIQFTFLMWYGMQQLKMEKSPIWFWFEVDIWFGFTVWSWVGLWLSNSFLEFFNIYSKNYISFIFLFFFNL